MATTTTSHGHDDELREHTALYVLGALTSSERAAFEAHLATCAECAAEVKTLADVPGALAQVVPQTQPSPELRERILKSARGAQALESPLTHDAPDAKSGGDMLGRVTRRAVILPWLAAAACLALAVGFGGYSLRLRARISDLEVALREAFVRLEMSNQQIADARRAAAEAQEQVAVLAAPDVTRFTLAGQQVAPEAAGRAYWTRARGLVFTASNLPALPPGRAYQLWVFTTPQAAPISNAWMIRPDTQGRVVTRFDTPVDIARPTAVAVSIEPERGVPAPTGNIYLIGQVSGS